jgi:hypothetical protein
MLVSQLLARLLVLLLKGVGRQHLFCEWHSVDHRVIDAVLPTILYRSTPLSTASSAVFPAGPCHQQGPCAVAAAACGA